MDKKVIGKSWVVGFLVLQEMSRYTMELIMDKWVKPSVDISKWEFYVDYPVGGIEVLEDGVRFFVHILCITVCPALVLQAPATTRRRACTCRLSTGIL